MVSLQARSQRFATRFGGLGHAGSICFRVLWGLYTLTRWGGLDVILTSAEAGLGIFTSLVGISSEAERTLPILGVPGVSMTLKNMGHYPE